jgi:hypothetical protein
MRQHVIHAVRVRRLLDVREQDHLCRDLSGGDGGAVGKGSVPRRSAPTSTPGPSRTQTGRGRSRSTSGSIARSPRPSARSSGTTYRTGSRSGRAATPPVPSRNGRGGGSAALRDRSEHTRNVDQRQRDPPKARNGPSMTVRRNFPRSALSCPFVSLGAIHSARMVASSARISGYCGGSMSVVIRRTRETMSRARLKRPYSDVGLGPSGSCLVFSSSGNSQLIIAKSGIIGGLPLARLCSS